MIPTEFFVTSARAVSAVSKLNAFDRALKNAGIAQCNLVPVSSVLPPNCVEKQWRKLPAGAITHAVVARMDGDEGAKIGAGISWAWEKAGNYGIVAEAHGHMNRKVLKETLAWKIREMAEIRGIEIKTVKDRIECIQVPTGNYGCVIATLVYCTLRYNTSIPQSSM